MSEDTELLRRIAIANAYTAQTLLRVAGMQAENQMREARGEPPAYVEKDFVAEESCNHVVSLLSL